MTPARLPTPGGDNDDWGNLLNGFLTVAHNGDGTLKPVLASLVTGLEAQGARAVNLPIDGVTDVGPIIQAAYDTGATSVRFAPNTIYVWNTPVFLDRPNAYGGLVIDGNKATVRLGAGLPTTTWSRNTATKFAIFPNTNRTGLVSGNVTVDDSTRATGSSGALRGLIVRDLMIDGQNANVGFAFANRTPCTFEHVILYQARVAHTWWSYTDCNTYLSCYSRGPAGTDEQVFVEQYQAGDGTIIQNPKCDAALGFAKLKTSRGAFITGGLVPMQFEECTGIVISGAHFEGQIAGASLLQLIDSQVTIQGSALYETWVASAAEISITDSSSTRTGSELILDQCVSQQLYTSESADVAFSPLVNIVSANFNTRVVVRDLKGMMTSSGIAGKWVSGTQTLITGPAALQTAMAAPAARAAVASGSFEITQRGDSSWSVTPPGTSAIVSLRQSSTPTITTVVNTGFTNGGTLTNGSTYAYAVAVLDALGNYSQASTETTCTATANKMSMLDIQVADSSAVLVIWRKTDTGVLSSPDRYVVIPARDTRTQIYDTGNYIGGRPWVTANVPVPSTVAATNNTMTALVVKGVVLAN